MTIRWRPDTCNCIIDMDPTTLDFADWVQKCPGHKEFDGQELLDNVKAQCLNFQISINDQKDPEKRNENFIAKRDEKLRISSLGSLVKNSKARRTTLNN